MIYSKTNPESPLINSAFKSGNKFRSPEKPGNKDIYKPQSLVWQQNGNIFGYAVNEILFHKLHKKPY